MSQELADAGASILITPVSYDGRGPVCWGWSVVATREPSTCYAHYRTEYPDPRAAFSAAIRAFNEYLDDYSEEWSSPRSFEPRECDGCEAVLPIVTSRTSSDGTLFRFCASCATIADELERLDAQEVSE